MEELQDIPTPSRGSVSSDVVTPVRSNVSTDTGISVVVPSRGTVRVGVSDVTRNSVTSSLGGGITPASPTTTGNTPPNIFTSNLSPFAILADIYNKTFSNNSNPYNTTGESNIVAVPVGTSGSNNNIIIGVIVLGAIAGIYYFYKGK